MTTANPFHYEMLGTTHHVRFGPSIKKWIDSSSAKREIPSVEFVRECLASLWESNDDWRNFSDPFPKEPKIASIQMGFSDRMVTALDGKCQDGERGEIVRAAVYRKYEER